MSGLTGYWRLKVNEVLDKHRFSSRDEAVAFALQNFTGVAKEFTVGREMIDAETPINYADLSDVLIRALEKGYIENINSAGLPEEAKADLTDALEDILLHWETKYENVLNKYSLLSCSTIPLR